MKNLNKIKQEKINNIENFITDLFNTYGSQTYQTYDWPKISSQHYINYEDRLAIKNYLVKFNYLTQKDNQFKFNINKNINFKSLAYNIYVNKSLDNQHQIKEVKRTPLTLTLDKVRTFKYYDKVQTFFNNIDNYIFKNQKEIGETLSHLMPCGPTLYTVFNKSNLSDLILKRDQKIKHQYIADIVAYMIKSYWSTMNVLNFDTYVDIVENLHSNKHKEFVSDFKNMLEPEIKLNKNIVKISDDKIAMKNNDVVEIDWNYISADTVLSEKYIETNWDKLNIDLVCLHQDLSKSFILRHFNFLNHDNIKSNKKIPKSVLFDVYGSDYRTITSDNQIKTKLTTKRDILFIQLNDISKQIEQLTKEKTEIQTKLSQIDDAIEVISKIDFLD